MTFVLFHSVYLHDSLSLFFSSLFLTLSHSLSICLSVCLSIYVSNYLSVSRSISVFVFVFSFASARCVWNRASFARCICRILSWSRTKTCAARKRNDATSAAPHRRRTLLNLEADCLCCCVIAHLIMPRCMDVRMMRRNSLRQRRLGSIRMSWAAAQARLVQLMMERRWAEPMNQ